MKQIFTLAAAALMAMSASAENTFVKENLSLVKINDNFKVSVQNAPAMLKAKRPRLRLRLSTASSATSFTLSGASTHSHTRIGSAPAVTSMCSTMATAP